MSGGSSLCNLVPTPSLSVRDTVQICQTHIQPTDPYLPWHWTLPFLHQIPASHSHPSWPLLDVGRSKIHMVFPPYHILLGACLFPAGHYLSPRFLTGAPSSLPSCIDTCDTKPPLGLANHGQCPLWALLLLLLLSSIHFRPFRYLADTPHLEAKKKI